MDNFRISIALVAMRICSITCLAGQEDKCEIYNENYKCPTGNGTGRILGYEANAEINNCTDDFVDETLRLIEKGLGLIKYSYDEQAVMVIGLSGTGKSTFVYFFAGDESKLIAYKASLTTYKIKDCNKKIGDGLASATIFPDMVQDPGTNISYYDNPGFADNRSPCVEIANSYFMTRVTSKLKSVQFIVTISYKALEELGRTDIPQTLKSILSFVPNIKKFKTSLTLAATKLADSRFSDEQWIEEVVTHLKKVQAGLGALDLTDNERENAEVILESIIARKSVIVFRSPDACGPLSEIPVMVANKRSMKKSLENVPFTCCRESDFNLTLSGDTKSKVKDIAMAVYKDIKTNLTEIASKIFSTWVQILIKPSDIFERQQKVRNFVNLATIINSQTADAFTSAATFQSYFESIRLILITNVPSFELQVQTFYQNFNKTVDFLEFLSDANAGIDWTTMDWDKIFNPLLNDINSEDDFIKMITNLFGQLTTRDKHYNDFSGYKKWYRNSTNFPVTIKNLELFLIKFQSLITSSADKDKLLRALRQNPESKFSTLNSLLKTTLATSFNCATVDSNGIATYNGTYLNFKNILSNNCDYRRLKTVVVFAFDKTFVDANFVSTDISKQEGINIVVISPRMPVENQNAFIDLKGFSPSTVEQLPCCGGADGAAGESGYNGGNFYAITAEMSSQYRLNVDCSGGNGANGQPGQPGKDGTKGATQTISRKHNPDCASWSGGWVQVRKYPNSCNPGGKWQVCYPDGGYIYIYGKAGSPGQHGGAGGNGGNGGLPGECQITCSGCNKLAFPVSNECDCCNKFSSYTIVAGKGMKGLQGTSGADGSPGKCGNTMVYKLYGYYHASGEYKCYYDNNDGNNINYFEREHQAGEPCSSYQKYNEASAVIKSNNENLQQNITAGLGNEIKTYAENNRRSAYTINIAEYKQLFVKQAQNHYDNEFIGKMLKEFVSTF